MFALLSSLILGLVNPGCGQGRNAHAVTNENYDIFGNVGVDRIQGLQSTVNLISAYFLPVINSYSMLKVSFCSVLCVLYVVTLQSVIG